MGKEKQNQANRLFSKTRLKSDDPFVLIKNVFIDGGYHRFAKIFNNICIVIHSSSFLLEANYLITNFSSNLLIKYGCAMSVMAYILASMIFAGIQEDGAIDLTKDILSNFWPIDICGSKVKNEIVKNSEKINRLHQIVLAIVGVWGIAMIPIWGDQKEWFLCVQVYEYYFGKWSKIPYYIYFFTYPWLAFSAIRLPFTMIYAISQIRMQVYLINQQIVEVSDEQDVYSKISDDKNYQEKIYKQLRLCILHHIMLKKWMGKLCNIVHTAMPMFMLLGSVATIAVVFYGICYFETINFVLKFRLMSVSVCAILIVYMFAEAGQSIYVETARVFDSLMICPWYVWNTKNRKNLLIFLVNTMEPMKFSLAGITLDYKYAMDLLKISSTYALILYKLNNSRSV